MKRLIARFHQMSIQSKLGFSFIVGCLILVFINGVTYLGLERMVSQIDNVYSSNIELNELSGRLDRVQDALYQYLETKSSLALEEYYVREQEYREAFENLNTRITDSEIALIEKNIYNISDSYLKRMSDTIFARRGRNVTGYKEGYADCEKLYKYLRNAISTLNSDIFLQNSDVYSVLRKNLNYLVGIAAVLLGCVMTVMIIWILFVTKSITRPLIQLAGAANEIALGNMDVSFPIIHTGDEITVVAKACNKMIDSIRLYIEETKANLEREAKHMENELIMQNDLKEAQLKYLQAQINPHFLFNTMNAGAQLAMMEGAEKTCIFIENMADFFRYNVRKMEQDTTLLEEIELVDHYIYILNVRFAGELQFEKTVNERLLNLRMPSMVLQPIVENAVNHGVRQKEGGGNISLEVYCENEMVCIEITDDGAGISEEKIEEIMKQYPAKESDSEEEKRNSGSGIGLQNVMSRLNRYYGRTDILQIGHGKNGRGTTVRLLIHPLKEGEKS